MGFRSDTLGEGKYFAINEKTHSIELTDNRAARANIIDIAQKILVPQKNTAPIKLAFRDLVHLEEALDSHFSHSPIIKLFSQIFTPWSASRNKKLSESIRNEIAKLAPESLIAKPYFSLKKDGTIERSITKFGAKEAIFDIITIAKKAIKEETPTLSFSEMLYLRHCFEERYKNKNWIIRGLLHLFNKTRDTDIQKGIDRAIAHYLDQAKTDPKAFRKVIEGYLENTRDFREISPNARTNIAAFIQTKSTSEILDQLKAGNFTQFFELCLSGLNLNKKVQKALLQRESLTLYLPNPKALSKTNKPLYEFLMRSRYFEGELAGKVQETTPRWNTLKEIKNPSHDEQLEMKLIGLIRAKAHLHSRRISLSGTVTSELETLGMSKKESEELDKSHRLTQGAVPFLAEQGIPHRLLRNRKDRSLLVVVQNGNEVYTYTSISGLLSPKDSHNFRARLFLAEKCIQHDPAAAANLLSPDGTTPHLFDLKGKEEEIKKERERIDLFLQNKYQNNPDATLVQLRALCYLHTLNPKESDKELAQHLLSSLGTQVPKIRLGPDEKRALLLLVPGEKERLDAISEAAKEARPISPPPSPLTTTQAPLEQPKPPAPIPEESKTHLNAMAEKFGIKLDQKSLEPIPPQVTEKTKATEHIRSSLEELYKNCKEALLSPKVPPQKDEFYQNIAQAFSENNSIKALELTQAKIRQAEEEVNVAKGKLLGLLTEGKQGILSAEQPLPSLETLFVLYAQDSLESLSRWGITVDQETISDSIASVLTNTQRLQKAKRVADGINKVLNTNDPDELAMVRDEVETEINKTQAYNPKEHKQFQLFEILINGYIYKEQFDNIKKLIDPNKNVILQQLMGSGKTFILIPLLALSRANGKNISIAMFPDALLKTVLSELQNRLGSGFSELVIEQPEITTSLSVQELKNLHTLIQNIQERRGILLFSPEKMHVLLNSFTSLIEDIRTTRDEIAKIRQNIEALKGTSLEIAEKKVQLEKAIQEKTALIEEKKQKLTIVSDILTLFKRRGAVFGDEVDDLLKTSLQYIISLGEEEKFPEKDSQLVGNLILFIQEQAKKKVWPAQLDFMLQAEGEKSPYLSTQEYDEKMLPQLMGHALELLKVESPEFKEAIERHQGEIEKYIETRRVTEKTPKGFAEKIEDTIEGLTPELQNKLQDLRRTLLHTLPATLNSHCNEDYGILNEQETPWAVPFVGPKSPAKTQFSSPQELIARTVQVYIKQGVPVGFLKKLSDNEKRTNFANDREKKEHDLAQGYADFFGKDALNFQACAQRLKTDQTLFKRFLEKFIYPQVTHHPESITSNSQKLVQAFHSFSGITGTFWNTSTMPTFDDRHPDSKTVGRSFNRLLTKAKDGQITVESFGTRTKHADNLSNKIIDKREKLYALIDSGGWLRDDEIEEFSQKILEGRDDLDYVVYHDDKKQLVRLTINRTVPQSNRNRFTITDTSEKMEKLDDEGMKRRFTIYRKQYTVGTDIPQFKTAKCIMSLGPSMIQRDFLQGLFRMRKIMKEQRAILAYDDEAKAALHESIGTSKEEKTDFLDWMRFFVTTEAKMRLDQNQQSTQERMDCQLEDLARTSISQLLKENKFEDALTTYSNTRKYFVKEKTKDHVDHIPRTMSREDRIARDIKQKVELFSKAMPEQQGLTEKLKGVVRLQDLPPEMESEAPQHTGPVLEQRQEAEQVAQIDKVRTEGQKAFQDIKTKFAWLDRRLQAKLKTQIEAIEDKETIAETDLTQLRTEVAHATVLNSLLSKLGMEEKAQAIATPTDAILMKIVQEMEQKKDLSLLSLTAEALVGFEQTKAQIIRSQNKLKTEALHDELVRFQTNIAQEKCTTIKETVREAIDRVAGKTATVEEQAVVLNQLKKAQADFALFKKDEKATADLQQTIQKMTNTASECTAIKQKLRELEQAVRGKVLSEQERHGIEATLKQAEEQFKKAQSALTESLSIHQLLDTAGLTLVNARQKATDLFSSGAVTHEALHASWKDEALKQISQLSLSKLVFARNELQKHDPLGLLESFREAVGARETLQQALSEELKQTDAAPEMANNRKELKKLLQNIQAKNSQAEFKQSQERLAILKKANQARLEAKQKLLQSVQNLTNSLGTEVKAFAGSRAILQKLLATIDSMDLNEVESQLKKAQELKKQYELVYAQKEFLKEQKGEAWTLLKRENGRFLAELDKGTPLVTEAIQDHITHIQHLDEAMKARDLEARRVETFANEALVQHEKIFNEVSSEFTAYETTFSALVEKQKALQIERAKSPLTEEAIREQTQTLSTLMQECQALAREAEKKHEAYIKTTVLADLQALGEAGADQKWAEASLAAKVAQVVVGVFSSKTTGSAQKIKEKLHQQTEQANQIVTEAQQEGLVTLTNVGVLETMLHKKISSRLKALIEERISSLTGLSLENVSQETGARLTLEHKALLDKIKNKTSAFQATLKEDIQTFKQKKEALETFVRAKAELQKSLKEETKKAAKGSLEQALSDALLKECSETLEGAPSTAKIQEATRALTAIENKKQALLQASREADALMADVELRQEDAQGPAAQFKKQMETIKKNPQAVIEQMMSLKKQHTEFVDRVDITQIRRELTTTSFTNHEAMENLFTRWASVQERFVGQAEKVSEMKTLLSSWWQGICTKEMKGSALAQSLEQTLLQMTSANIHQVQTALIKGFNQLTAKEKTSKEAEEVIHRLTAEANKFQSAANKAGLALTFSIAIQSESLTQATALLAKETNAAKIDEALEKLRSVIASEKQVLQGLQETMKQAIQQEAKESEESQDLYSALPGRYTDVQKAKEYAQKMLSQSLSSLSKGDEAIVQTIQSIRKAKADYAQKLEKAISSFTLQESLVALEKVKGGSLRTQLEVQRDLCIRKEMAQVQEAIQTFAGELDAIESKAGLETLLQSAKGAKTSEQFLQIHSALQAERTKHAAYLTERVAAEKTIQTALRSSHEGIRSVAKQIQSQLKKALPSELVSSLTTKTQALEEQYRALASLRENIGKYTAFSEKGKRLADQHKQELLTDAVSIERTLNQGTVESVQALEQKRVQLEQLEVQTDAQEKQEQITQLQTAVPEAARRNKGVQVVYERALNSLQRNQLNIQDERQLLSRIMEQYTRLSQEDLAITEAQSTLGKRAKEVCSQELQNQVDALRTTLDQGQLVSFTALQTAHARSKQLVAQIDAEAQNVQAILGFVPTVIEGSIEYTNALQEEKALREHLQSFVFSYASLENNLSEFKASVQALATMQGKIGQLAHILTTKKQFNESASAFFNQKIAPNLATLSHSLQTTIRAKWEAFVQAKNTGTANWTEYKTNVDRIADFVKDAVKETSSLKEQESKLSALQTNGKFAEVLAQQHSELQKMNALLEEKFLAQIEGKQTTTLSTQMKEKLNTLTETIKTLHELNEKKEITVLETVKAKKKGGEDVVITKQVEVAKYNEALSDKLLSLLLQEGIQGRTFQRYYALAQQCEKDLSTSLFAATTNHRVVMEMQAVLNSLQTDLATLSVEKLEEYATHASAVLANLTRWTNQVTSTEERQMDGFIDSLSTLRKLITDRDLVAGSGFSFAEYFSHLSNAITKNEVFKETRERICEQASLCQRALAEYLEKRLNEVKTTKAEYSKIEASIAKFRERTLQTREDLDALVSTFHSIAVKLVSKTKK